MVLVCDICVMCIVQICVEYVVRMCVVYVKISLKGWRTD